VKEAGPGRRRRRRMPARWGATRRRHLTPPSGGAPQPLAKRVECESAEVATRHRGATRLLVASGSRSSPATRISSSSSLCKEGRRKEVSATESRPSRGEEVRAKKKTAASGRLPGLDRQAVDVQAGHCEEEGTLRASTRSGAPPREVGLLQSAPPTSVHAKKRRLTSAAREERTCNGAPQAGTAEARYGEEAHGWPSGARQAEHREARYGEEAHSCKAQHRKSGVRNKKRTAAKRTNRKACNRQALGRPARPEPQGRYAVADQDRARPGRARSNTSLDARPHSLGPGRRRLGRVFGLYDSRAVHRKPAIMCIMESRPRSDCRVPEQAHRDARHRA